MASGKMIFEILPSQLEWEETNIYVDHLRYTEGTVFVNYENGGGQQLTAGQVLYEHGTPGDPGYVVITNLYDTTLSLSGTIEFYYYHYALDPHVIHVADFMLFGSPIKFNFI